VGPFALLTTSAIPPGAAMMTVKEIEAGIGSPSPTFCFVAYTSSYEKSLWAFKWMWFISN
jgi:hypothetical protein